MFDDRGLANPTSLADPLYHRTCGGRVSTVSLYGGSVYQCTGPNCDRSWSGDRMKQWLKSGEIGDRFFTQPDPDPTEWTLVEKVEGDKCYLSLVPPEEVHKYKKVKLP